MGTKEEILPLYQLYVEMADRVSERRNKNNQFYMALLSSLLIIVSFIVNNESLNLITKFQGLVFPMIGLLGVLICFIWMINIKSYRQLNTAKFRVIHEMEAHLAFPGFKKEWELLGSGKNGKKYLQLTRIEQFIPLLLMTPFISMFVLSLLNL